MEECGGRSIRIFGAEEGRRIIKNSGRRRGGGVWWRSVVEECGGGVWWRSVVECGVVWSSEEEE